MKVLRAFACGTFLFPPPRVGPVEVMGLLGTAFKVEPLARAEKDSLEEQRKQLPSDDKKLTCSS